MALDLFGRVLVNRRETARKTPIEPRGKIQPYVHENAPSISCDGGSTQSGRARRAMIAALPSLSASPTPERVFGKNLAKALRDMFLRRFLTRRSVRALRGAIGPA